MSGPARLQQVLWNLITNALKFTDKGGRVHVLLERVNSHLEISVTDSGQGITPEFLPHVFDRFRQADASSTRSYRGLGLGLAIVKNLAELHGGGVRAKSPGLNQGATFTVTLLVTLANSSAISDEQKQSGASRAADEAQFSLQGVRVLAVDDEPDARNLVKRILTATGAIVDSAGSAAEAMELLKKAVPDVLITDIGTDRRRAILSGFQMHIAKPVEPSELLAMVANLAKRTGQRRS